MTTKFDTTIQTKAPLPKAIEYFLHPENISKVHPGFVKEVKITANNGDKINFEQEGVIMGRKLKQEQLLSFDRATNTFTIDTLSGDGKGSKLSSVLKEIPTGTEVHYSAAMELGPLGFFAKGPAKSTFEKVTQEDKQQLDMLA
ncbi:MAG: hypothetical protein OK456_02280 [Thaumarchaeota archaeon]|nr:hypothetical protein [Nitrososphaerota archaeon]